MLNIIENKYNTIYYKCDCGTKGVCSVKPLDHDATIVIVLKCPACGDAEKITLLQYSSDEIKDALIKNLNDSDFSWSPYLNEEV